MVETGDLTEFSEIELSHRDEPFADIAHRLSAYAKYFRHRRRRMPSARKHSTQFIRTPAGRRITSMAWDDERPGLSIPDYTAS